MGGMEYIRNIILALTSLPQTDRSTFEISLVVSSSSEQAFISSVRPYLKNVYFIDELGPRTLFNRVKWMIKREVFFKKMNFDFVYPVMELHFGISNKRVTTWIPDFQHKYLMELFTEQEIKARDKSYTRLAQQAYCIVFSSMSSEADFRKFYPENAANTRVLPFKTIPQQQWYDVSPVDIQKKYCLPDKFLIISNQFWMHKNHLTVFKALKHLKDIGICPNVVCTGRIFDYRQPDYSDSILQTIHTLGLSQQVYLLGLIPKIDQIQLLRRSIALIQPSLFEGWSSVVEDARCMGKPLILSDLPVHLEQNPPQTRFFERSSPESLAPIMADCWNTLLPGPDFERETIAREVNRNEVATFAKLFLAIAKSSTNDSYLESNISTSVEL